MSRPVGLLLLLCAGRVAYAQSGIRAVHLLVGAPAVSCYVDSTLLAVPSLNEGVASSVVPLTAGSHRITITGVGAPFEFAVVDTTVTFAADSIYAVVLSGSFDLSITRATILSAPSSSGVDSTTASVRFANLAIGLDTVSVEASLGTDPAFAVDALPYGGVSLPRSGQAGDATIRLSRLSPPPFYRGRGYPVGGSVTTVLLTGVYTSGLERFVVVSLADNDTNAQDPLPAFASLPLEQGAFRAVNVASGFGALDLFRDGAPADSVPVGFPFASAERTDLLGNYTFSVARLGQGRGAVIQSVDVNIPADSLTTLYLLDPASADPKPVSFVATNSNATILPPDQSLFRVLNASPDVGAIDVEIIPTDSARRTVTLLDYSVLRDAGLIQSGGVSVVIRAQSGVYRYVGGIAGDGVITVIVNGRVGDSSLAVNLFVESKPSEQEPMVYLTRSSVGSVARDATMHIAQTTVIPNPALAVMRVQFSAERSGAARLELHNELGTCVKTTALEDVHSGINVIPCDVSGLPSAEYRVLVRDVGGLPIATGGVLIVH